ncbi:hypothetical protein RUM43_004061 [Polyplax serrata]|uniref:Uncharacterized protein n=1 Tax=Polyplax serrata TaxID=468196 RepID=A0AAN8SAY2_POLSC
MSAPDDDKITEKEKIIIIRTRPKTREEEREEAEEEPFPSGGADSSRLYLSAVKIQFRRLWVFPKRKWRSFSRVERYAGNGRNKILDSKRSPE